MFVESAENLYAIRAVKQAVKKLDQRVLPARQMNPNLVIRGNVFL